MNTSRKLLLAGAAVIAVTAAATGASAQNSASASATASVTVIRPISITATGSLSFGRVVLDGSATNATIVVTPANGVTTTHATQVAGGSTSVPTFTVNGEGGQGYTIALTTAGFTGVTLGSLTSSVASPGTLSGSLGGAGSQAFQVGGTMTIPVGTTAGTYSGSVTATVTYQ